MAARGPPAAQLACRLLNTNQPTHYIHQLEDQLDRHVMDGLWRGRSKYDLDSSHGDACTSDELRGDHSSPAGRRPEATPSHRRRVAVSGHGETDRVIHLSLFQITSVCAKDLSGAS